MKTVKLLFFSVVFTLTFCFAAFASEKKIPATENFTNDVVYDNPRNLEDADANNLAAFLPQIEKFQVKKSTVTAIVQKLVQKGYVYKCQSQEDLRVYHIHLAPKGEQLIQLEDEGYRYFAKQLTACLDETERKQFAMMLQKMNEKAHENRK